MGTATQRYTSRIFAAVRKLAESLEEQDFPAHPVTGNEVVVCLGDDHPDDGAERVICWVPADGAALDWARLSKPGRTENLTLRISIKSYVGTSTYAEAIDRLETLADAAQEAVFNTTTTGQPVVSLGFDGERVAQITRITPTFSTLDDGWVGDCDIDIEVISDI